MKKSVSVMMAIALCAAMVSGCSGSGGQKDTAADTKAAVETTASGAAEKGSEEQTAAAENKKIDKRILRSFQRTGRDCNGNRTIKGDVKDRTRQGRV